MDGCAGAAPFILKSVIGSAQWLRSLSIRTSFFSWEPGASQLHAKHLGVPAHFELSLLDDYSVFSAFHTVTFLKITLASPTADRKLSPGRPLLSLYRAGVEGILTHLLSAPLSGSSANSTTAVRNIAIVFEPGYGTVRYLSGLGNPAEREASETGVHQELGQWSYGMGRAAAVEGLLGAGFEEILVHTDSGRLRASFSGLKALSIRLWDPYESEGHTWWFSEVSKRLPTLHAMRILHVDVRDDCEHRATLLLSCWLRHFLRSRDEREWRLSVASRVLSGSTVLAQPPVLTAMYMCVPVQPRYRHVRGRTSCGLIRCQWLTPGCSSALSLGSRLRPL